MMGRGGEKELGAKAASCIARKERSESTAFKRLLYVTRFARRNC